MVNNLNRNLTKENIKMAYKHMERYTTSLVFRDANDEIFPQTTRMAKFYNTNNIVS